MTTSRPNTQLGEIDHADDDRRQHRRNGDLNEPLDYDRVVHVIEERAEIDSDCFR